MTQEAEMAQQADHLPAIRESSAASIMEAVIAQGDLSKLTPEQRSRYYMEVCRSVGLNPLTQPFEYLVLKGKTVLYAKKGAAEQLRNIYKIDVTETRTQYEDDLVVVTVCGEDRNGRRDSEIGAVSIAGLRGEDKANALMKALTKAKRRLTLSMVGLGMLDESEVTDAVTYAETSEIRSIRPVAVPAAEAPTSKRGKSSKVVLPNGDTVERDSIPDPVIKAMNRAHAIGNDRGLDHTALHLLGLACGFHSLTVMSETELLALGDWIETAPPEEIEGELDKGRQIETGEQIVAEFTAKLQAAPNEAAVLGIGEEIKSAGIDDDRLRAAYKHRLAMFRAAG